MTTIKYVQFAYIILCEDHSGYDLKNERVREHRKEILEVAQTKMPLQKAVGPMVERFIH